MFINTLNCTYVYNSVNTIKTEFRPLRLLVMRFGFYKKLDLIIIKWLIDKIQKHLLNLAPIKSGDAIIIWVWMLIYAYIKNETVHNINDKVPWQICRHTIVESIVHLSYRGKRVTCFHASYMNSQQYLEKSSCVAENLSFEHDTSNIVDTVLNRKCHMQGHFHQLMMKVCWWHDPISLSAIGCARF